MARSTFESVIRLRLDQFTPEAAKAKHIQISRQGLVNFLARQQAQPDVQLEVDNHSAISEEQVRPFGVITYRFLRMKEITVFALAEARRISPVLRGRYRDSWFAMVDGAEVDPATVSASAVVTVTNDQPYSRKINVGAKGFEKYVPPGIVEKVRQAVQRRYGMLVSAQVDYITLQGGYVLKRDLRKIVGGRRYGGPRRDASAGMQITYPALTITPKNLRG